VKKTLAVATVRIMAANADNVPQLRGLLHHTQDARSRWCIVHCTRLQKLWIYDSFDDCWFAKHSSISVYKMSRPMDFQNL